LDICERKLCQFSALGTLSALHLVAQRPDNFKVRRDVAFAALTARAAAVLGSLEATPQELVSAAWAVAKLGLKNRPLLDSLSAQAIAKLPEFNPPGVVSLAWSYALIAVTNFPLMTAIAEQFV